MLGGDDAKAREKPPLAADTYYQLAQKDPMLQKDPTEGMQSSGLSLGGSVFYVRSCCGPYTPIVHPDNAYFGNWLLLGILFVTYELFLTPSWLFIRRGIWGRQAGQTL